MVLEAVTVHDEWHSVDSGGGGVKLKEIKLSGDALEEWILRESSLRDRYEQAKGNILLYDGAPMQLQDAVTVVAEYAGSCLDHVEEFINRNFRQPSSPKPRIDSACWECAGTYEYQRSGGDNGNSFEYWNAGIAVTVPENICNVVYPTQRFWYRLTSRSWMRFG